MNAMEHGSEYRADRPVSVRVLTAAGVVRVQITDLGGAPAGDPERRGARPRGQARRAASARAAGASS